MIQVRLPRITAHPNEGTFGVLIIDGIEFCVSLEPYSRDNAQGISCINAGVYLCKRVFSPKFNCETFEVTDVQGRTVVRFHWGNIDEHTEACILLGAYYGRLHGNRAILNSKRTFRKFMKIMQGIDEFGLTITESY